MLLVFALFGVRILRISGGKPSQGSRHRHQGSDALLEGRGPWGQVARHAQPSQGDPIGVHVGTGDQPVDERRDHPLPTRRENHPVHKEQLALARPVVHEGVPVTLQGCRNAVGPHVDVLSIAAVREDHGAALLARVVRAEEPHRQRGLPVGDVRRHRRRVAQLTELVPGAAPGPVQLLLALGGVGAEDEEQSLGVVLRRPQSAQAPGLPVGLAALGRPHQLVAELLEGLDVRLRGEAGLVDRVHRGEHLAHLAAAEPGPAEGPEATEVERRVPEERHHPGRGTHRRAGVRRRGPGCDPLCGGSVRGGATGSQRDPGPTDEPGERGAPAQVGCVLRCVRHAS